MSLRTYVAYGYEVCTGDLALDGEFVLFGVRQGVVIEVCRGASNRTEGAEKVRQCVIREACRRVGDGKTLRGIGRREEIADRVSGRAICEGSGKIRIGLTGVIAKGRVPDFIEVGRAFKRSIEDAPCGTDAGATGLA